VEGLLQETPFAISLTLLLFKKLPRATPNIRARRRTSKQEYIQLIIPPVVIESNKISNQL